MYRGLKLRPPFFEIGPKSYLYGKQILDLAKAADVASKKYDIDIIFTAPYADIRMVAEETENIFVIAPHMDPLPIGRGLADVLPESIKAAGAVGVMLNHCEKPVSLSVMRQTIKRADEVGLITIVCADSIAEAKAVAMFEPNVIVAEPTELIGTGKSSNMDYVQASMEAIKSINPEIMVLNAAGISSGKDVYNVIFAGSDATGSSSGIAKAPDSAAMVDEMIHAAREAWNDRKKRDINGSYSG
jgi:triosephosphate isomerase